MRVVVVAILILGLPNLSLAGWIQVSVTNPASSALGGYPVQLALNSSFPFDESTSDGSDIQIYDGTRKEQFASYIQGWDKSGASGTVWFRLPYLQALSSTNLWLHYSSSGSFQPRLLPWGPYIPSPDNPIAFINRGTHTNLLVENVVYDPDTGHWWMVMGDNASVSIDVAYSDDPTNATAWTWWGSIVTGENGNGPSLVKDGSTWYLFEDHNKQIAYRTASSITGPYSTPTTVLTKGTSDSWESYRVTEPYVFKRGPNDWVLLYMGDSHTDGNPTEQVGYATATSITGPYNKYPGNPFIGFGPPGAYDAGTAADPWVFQVGSVYYIGYSISPTYKSPWKTGFACTSDWTNVLKLGQLFATGEGWDAGNALRGAVTSVSGTFLLPYMSSATPYKAGISTARFATNDPGQVFLWQDDFSGSSIDPTFWHSFSQSGQIRVKDGILTLSCSSNFLEVNGPSVGQDYVAEFRARHRTHGTLNHIMEIGLGTPNTTCVRLDDDYTDTVYWEGRTRISSETVTNLQVTADSDWHTFAVARTNGAALWKVDNSNWTVVSDTNVDSSSFQGVFMLAYGVGDVVDVDWVRIRRFVSPEPSAALNLGTPTVTQQPSSQTVAQGETARFIVVAAGDPPLSYQWRLNGSSLAGATTASYSVPGATVSDAGTYDAIVSNEHGSVTSTAALLTVLVPPVITVQPTSQTVGAGSTVSFQVSASGDSPLSYQWWFNCTNAVGTSTDTLALTNVQPSQAGGYSVSVANPAGTVTSMVATLTIGLPPSITKPPSSLTVIEGHDATFSLASSGDTPLGYQWRFDESPVRDGTDSTYTVAAATPASAGAYDVIVSNPYGSVTSVVAQLTVLVPPAINTQPTNQTVIVGGTVSFLVNVSGSSPLSYQWWFNDTNALDADTNLLAVVNAQASQAGSYTVVATNLAGAVTSRVAQLTVLLLPPSIATQPTNQTVIAGANASFLAKAMGSSPMSYQWFFFNKPIPGATSDSLSISNVQVVDAGTYALMITNAAGSATSSNAYLKVLVPPTLAAPEAVGLGVLVPVPSVAGLSYLLEYKKDLEDPTWTAVSSWVPGTGDILVLQDTNVLSAPRFYRVRCH